LANHQWDVIERPHSLSEGKKRRKVVIGAGADQEASRPGRGTVKGRGALGGEQGRQNAGREGPKLGSMKEKTLRCQKGWGPGNNWMEWSNYALRKCGTKVQKTLKKKEKKHRVELGGTASQKRPKASGREPG